MPEAMSPEEEQVYTDAEADEIAKVAVEEEAEAPAEIPADAHPHEGDDTDAVTSSEAEPTPSPSAGSITLEEFEQRAKKVAQSFATYTRKVSSELPMLADDLTPCPLCPELHPGFVDVNDAGRLPAEVVQVVELFLGRQQEAEYRSNAETKACDGCDGLGKVKSGSKVANYALLTCPQCQGTGFYPPPNGAVPTAPPPVKDGNGNLVETFRAEQTNEDPWGSPRLLANGTENPNYGRMPQYKDATLP